VRTLFFGTSAFAVPSLHVLAERTEVVGVITQPDRPSGRGQKLQPTPVKSAALALGLRVHEPTKLKAFALELEGLDFDLFALASYGRILPASLLALPKGGALNVHPSLLPRYRGATPIQSALRDGEQTTGVSIMLMDAGMDTGDIVLQEPVAIAFDDTYGTLHDRLALYGGELLGRALDLALPGPLPRHAQSGEPSMTRPIGRDDLTLESSWPAERIMNTVRAFSPSPAARLTVDGETLKVLSAHIGDDGAVQFDEVVAPNRGKMTYEAYLRSRRNRESA
jgi:methionyl-tRNA formyltransferase